jgi:hypothetical protein
MPYHAMAPGVEWEAPPSNYQGFLIGVALGREGSTRGG